MCWRKAQQFQRIVSFLALMIADILPIITCVDSAGAVDNGLLSRDVKNDFGAFTVFRLLTPPLDSENLP